MTAWAVMARNTSFTHNGTKREPLSGNSEELTGNDGPIRMVKLNIANDIEVGIYMIQIMNASYSTPDGKLVNLPNVTSSITVMDYIKGDVNDNKKVDIGDWRGRRDGEFQP